MLLKVLKELELLWIFWRREVGWRLTWKLRWIEGREGRVSGMEEKGGERERGVSSARCPSFPPFSFELNNSFPSPKRSKRSSPSESLLFLFDENPESPPP